MSIKLKQKQIKGKLSLYYATGESMRAQFIGNKSVDKKGRVINYKEVWDVKAGDIITLDASGFVYGWFKVEEDGGIYSAQHLITVLGLVSKNEIKALFTPGPNTKSWAELTSASKK